MAVLLCPMVTIAQEAQDRPPTAESAAATTENAAGGSAEQVPAPSPAPDYPFAETAGKRFHAMHLQVDGNLAGRLSTFDSSETLRPARGTVYFVRGGEIVTSARAIEKGRFQAAGLQPGAYSVLVGGPDGYAVFSVLVSPFDERVPEDRLLLDITLIPLEDLLLLRHLVPKAPSVPAAAAALGGGGGGGGGGAGALGLLGLAGLAGLGGQPPATPHRP